MVRRSTQKKQQSSGRVLHLRSSDDEHLMDSLIRRGPITFVLIYSTSCPHCHTYMPAWKQMCAMKDKKANMVSMEADTYMGTQMSAKKSVEGVPTVLYVSPSGSISEVATPRDTTTMSTAVQRGVTDEEAKRLNSGTPVTLSQPTPYPTSVPSSSATSSSPSSTTEANTLHPFPGTPVSSATMEQRLLQTGGSQTGGIQTGGSPWAAFLMAAQQAAPAAALLGAYTMIKKPVRSSGLGRPRRSNRRTRRRHRS
jgi:hypothetical protein